MIFVVEERGVSRDNTIFGELHKRTKQRYVEYILFSRYWLIVQFFKDLKGQNRFEVCIREKVGVVVANEIDDIEYNTKERIDIDKEYISFFIYLSNW